MVFLKSQEQQPNAILAKSDNTIDLTGTLSDPLVHKVLRAGQKLAPHLPGETRWTFAEPESRHVVSDERSTVGILAEDVVETLSRRIEIRVWRVHGQKVDALTRVRTNVLFPEGVLSGAACCAPDRVPAKQNVIRERRTRGDGRSARA